MRNETPQGSSPPRVRLRCEKIKADSIESEMQRLEIYQQGDFSNFQDALCGNLIRTLRTDSSQKDRIAGHKENLDKDDRCSGQGRPSLALAHAFPYRHFSRATTDTLSHRVESLTPHGEHETDEEHHYDHLSTHSHPSSPGHHNHHHLHHEEPEAFGTPLASGEGETEGETMVDAEQEARDCAKAFALKRQGTGLASGVWMGREDEEAAGVPFGGAIKVPQNTTGTSKDVPAHMRMNSRTALMRRRSSVQDRCQEAVGGASGRGVAGLNATLGLVIHAMADGIALGASSLSGSGGLGLIVFVAVIVHKGPTALGLTTTLLTLGLTKPQIRTRLLLFSASAPIGAVITYMIVKAVGGGQNKVPDTEVDLIGWWTGVVLLFSGGSFLYVATVISPLSDSDAHGTHQHAHQGKHDEADGQALGQNTRLGLLLAGMIGPWALSMLISHGH